MIKIDLSPVNESILSYQYNSIYKRNAVHGFTLIELMVAISILGLVAVLSWRGLDGMMRAQSATQTRADQIVATQSALGQWRADIDALVQVSTLPPLDWNGQALRMTRRSLSAPIDGLLVVGWTTRKVDGQNHWLRWQSPPLRSVGDLQNAWAKAANWARNPSDDDKTREIDISAITDWQVFYYRGNAWSSPFSSDANGQGQSGQSVDLSMPDGIRLNVTLPPNNPLAGQLTVDWVRPTQSGGKN